MSATPRPWTVDAGRQVTTARDANGHSILTVEYAGDYSGTAWAGFVDDDAAALIVRAVNSHDELVAALEGLLEVSCIPPVERWAATKKAEAALARAKGEQP